MLFPYMNLLGERSKAYHKHSNFPSNVGVGGALVAEAPPPLARGLDPHLKCSSFLQNLWANCKLLLLIKALSILTVS